MSHRFFASLGVLTAAVGIMSAAAVRLTAEAPKAARNTKATTDAKSKTIPRTPWGVPDLNGVWSGSTMTPLERPAEYAAKAVLSADEATALEKRQTETALVDRAPREGDPGTYNQVWTDPAYKVLPDRRTSLIVDPPDGKIPYTPEGLKSQTRSKARYGKGPYNSHLDLDTGERCLTDGLPIYFTGYNNNYQIFQSRDYVAILHEYYHEVRIIPLDGRPYGSIPQWFGDGRGHWEGDTLVVDTVRFADKGNQEWADAWRASRATTHLIERFTRKADSIEYQFTWEDPTMFTRPWTARWPLSTQAAVGVTQGPLYEYACHEGNYALPDVLLGARAKEKQAAEAGKKGSN